MDADDEVTRAQEPRTGAAASGSAPDGTPVHRGWPPFGPRRRWLEPFVLVLLAEGGGHGYALIGQLAEMGVADGDVDVGQVYKTLRDLEQAGHVVSTWSNEPTGPQRRDYELTASGRRALAEWAAVMRERRRLIEDFEARFRRSTESE